MASVPKNERLPKRKRKLAGTTHRIPLDCGRTLYLTITKNESNEIQELFVSLGKVGECVPAWAESFARTASLYLRNGGVPGRLVETLENIRCSEGKGSCPHLIAKALKEEMN